MSEGTHTPADVRGRIIRASILPIEDEETMIASLRSGAEGIERGELDVDDFVGVWSQYLRELFRRASSVPAPADVRERVAKEVYLWEATRFGADESWALRRWREESNTRRRLYFDVADRIIALLRTPRGEGEAWRDFLAALDDFEAAANLWVDPEGPTAEDMDRLRQARQRVIACARALAALSSEAQGDGPVGAVCANCGAPNAAIAGGELDPDEAVCSVECYEQLRELGCPQEHGGTYRPKPARRGEGGGNG